MIGVNNKNGEEEENVIMLWLYTMHHLVRDGGIQSKQTETQLAQVLILDLMRLKRAGDGTYLTVDLLFLGGGEPLVSIDLSSWSYEQLLHLVYLACQKIERGETLANLQESKQLQIRDLATAIITYIDHYKDETNKTASLVYTVGVEDSYKRICPGTYYTGFGTTNKEKKENRKRFQRMYPFHHHQDGYNNKYNNFSSLDVKDYCIWIIVLLMATRIVWVRHSNLPGGFRYAQAKAQYQRQRRLLLEQHDDPILRAVMERDLRNNNDQKGNNNNSPPRTDEEIQLHLDTVRTRIQDVIDKGNMPATFRTGLRSDCRASVLALVTICTFRVLHLGRVDDSTLLPILVTLITCYLLSKLEERADDLDSVV